MSLFSGLKKIFKKGVKIAKGAAAGFISSGGSPAGALLGGAAKLAKKGSSTRQLIDRFRTALPAVGSLPVLPGVGPVIADAPFSVRLPPGTTDQQILAAVQGSLGSQVGGVPSMSPILPVMGAAPNLAGALTTFGSIVATTTGRIRGIMTSAGKLVSARKAALMARRFGLDVAAAVLGVTAVDLARIALQQTTVKRNRGISYRDLKITRRTNQRLAAFSHYVCGRQKRPSRKPICR